MADLLAHRRAKYDQAQLRLQEQEIILKERERKARVRRLIRAGELLEKTGLLALDAEVIYGALLSLENGAQDEKTHSRWRKAGIEKLELEAAEKDKAREPFVIVFSEIPPKGSATQAALHQVGFKRAGLPGWFRGEAILEEALTITRGPYAGTLHRVSTDNSLVPVETEPAELKAAE